MACQPSPTALACYATGDPPPDWAYWLPWGEWSRCATTCSHSTKRRHRSCSSGRVIDCMHGAGGGATQEQRCSHISCPIWGPWGPCSKTCGTGYQTRTCQQFCVNGKTFSRLCGTNACSAHIVGQFEISLRPCATVGSLHTYRGWVTDMNVCAHSCESYQGCRGFTYTQAEKSCFFERSWCPTPSVKRAEAARVIRDAVSYKKLEPDGFDCGLAQCKPCTFKKNHVKCDQPEAEKSFLARKRGLFLIRDCAKLCKKTPECLSFQWGPTKKGAKIRSDSRNLDCFLFSRRSCKSVITAKNVRYCSVRRDKDKEKDDE